MVLPINELKPEQTDAIAKFMRIVTTRRFYSETCSVATDDIEARGAIVNFTTGGGKTLVALGAVRALMDKGLIDHVVILVPTQTLVQQWKSQFFEKSLASASDINGLEIPSQIKGVELDARPCSDQRGIQRLPHSTITKQSRDEHYVLYLGRSPERACSDLERCESAPVVDNITRCDVLSRAQCDAHRRRCTRSGVRLAPGCCAV